MKHNSYSLKDKVAYYERQRKNPKMSSRSIGFLAGVDYARSVMTKKTVDTFENDSEIRRGFYAGVRSYNNENGKKNSKGRL